MRIDAANHRPTITPITFDQSRPPLPDKPSIAVLPFQNMSGDPEQEYFADGLAQEAEAHAQLALRLSPRGYGIGTAHLVLAMAHFTLRNHAEAVRWCESAIQVSHRAPIRRALMIACSARAGDMARARAEIAVLDSFAPVCVPKTPSELLT